MEGTRKHRVEEGRGGPGEIRKTLVTETRPNGMKLKYRLCKSAITLKWTLPKFTNTPPSSRSALELISSSLPSRTGSLSDVLIHSKLPVLGFLTRRHLPPTRRSQHPDPNQTHRALPRETLAYLMWAGPVILSTSWRHVQSEALFISSSYQMQSGTDALMLVLKVTDKAYTPVILSHSRRPCKG